VSQGNPIPEGEAGNVPTVSLRDAQTLYVNFCRVIGTPEELIIDFGMNASSVNDAEHPMVTHQRIALNLLTAKRLMQTLQISVQRHEAAFGPLETDIQRRLIVPQG
jgi:hypothetical protein